MSYEGVPTTELPSPPTTSSPGISTFRSSPLNPSSPPPSTSKHGLPQPPLQPASHSTDPSYSSHGKHSSRDTSDHSSGSSHDSNSTSSSSKLSPFAAASANRKSQRPVSTGPPPVDPRGTFASKKRDSYAATYGAPASASGPDAGSLNAIAAGRVGGSYGPFPAELTAVGMGPGGSYSTIGSRSSLHGVSTMNSTSGATRGQTGAHNRWQTMDASHRRASSLSGSDTLHFGGLAPAAAITAGVVAPRMPTDRYSSASFMSDDGSVDGGSGVYSQQYAETTENLLWKEENKEADDFLHDPDPILDQRLDRKVAFWSRRGWMNVISLFVLITGLITLFALYPVITYVINHKGAGDGWNLGGINASGQVPDIPNLPSLVDRDTPDSAKTRTGWDGRTKYDLVFSDEFNLDGRTFWPGDDPFWEAVDLHYWQTTNFEWYDPDAVQTRGGNMEIELTMEPIHDLSFRSGMVAGWNQFCFTEGYIEVNVSLPGDPSVTGMWPGAWTMGNLARAGFGASNDGMWPFSYDACDVGTLPNQTNPDGQTPTAARTSGSRDYGGELSWSPGQRTSACTCPGEEHPGPKNSVGRSGPEIDIIEAQYGYGPSGALGSVSQSLQIAPMDAAYAWGNGTGEISIDNTVAANSQAATGTLLNTWHGSINQESLSGITLTDGTSYNGRGFQTFGFEYKRGYDADGAYIKWSYNGQPTWTVYANAIGADADTQISARPVSMEPMYVILNLGLSSKFQVVEWTRLTLPVTYLIDYVRIYQREGDVNIGCNPDDYPTEKYINDHMTAYKNPNATTWAQAGYNYPKNSLKDQC